MIVSSQPPYAFAKSSVYMFPLLVLDGYPGAMAGCLLSGAKPDTFPG